MTFKLPWMEASEYAELNNKIKILIEEEPGLEVEVTVRGMVPLFQRTLVAAMNSMTTSYAMAFFYKYYDGLITWKCENRFN